MKTVIMGAVSRATLVQVTTDITVFIIVTIFALLLSFNKLTAIQPYIRGFFCDDQSLMYPYRDDSISTITTAILSLLPPTIIILFTEAFLSKNDSKRMRIFVKNCYSMIGCLFLGFSLCVLFIEIVKMFVGRLRPHFFSVCQPSFSSTNCSRKFITNYSCQGKDLESISDSKKSFPSGHSGAAWNGMVFLAIYIQIRVRRHWPRLRVACPLLQFVAVSVAAYVSISRLQDYKHHTGDVIGGGIIGILFTIIVMYQNPNVKRHFLHHYDQADLGETMDTVVCMELHQENKNSAEIPTINGQAKT